MVAGEIKAKKRDGMLLSNIVCVLNILLAEWAKLIECASAKDIRLKDKCIKASILRHVIK